VERYCIVSCEERQEKATERQEVKGHTHTHIIIIFIVFLNESERFVLFLIIVKK